MNFIFASKFTYNIVFMPLEHFKKILKFSLILTTFFTLLFRIFRLVKVGMTPVGQKLDVIDPWSYYKDNLHAIRSGKRGHLPIFTLIYIIIPRGGEFNGGLKSGRANKYHSICPHIYFDKTSFFGGKDWSDPPICSRDPICSYYVENLELKSKLQRQSNIFPLSPITERSRMEGHFFGIIRWLDYRAIIWV